MSALVILSLALVVLAVGMVVVAAIALRRAVRGLSEAAGTARERIAPLAEELQAEQAVTALELEALQRTTSARDTRTAGRGREVPS